MEEMEFSALDCCSALLRLGFSEGSSRWKLLVGIMKLGFWNSEGVNRRQSHQGSKLFLFAPFLTSLVIVSLSSVCCMLSSAETDV